MNVFVVEQSCPYPELDGADERAFHIWLRDENGIAAYARVLPPGTTFPTAAIGRVIAVRRREGLGTKIARAALDTAKDKFGADTVTIEAQACARALCEKLGFRRTSDEFLEDGIPHIEMQVNV